MKEQKEDFKKYYEPPFKYDGYNYVWSENNTMSLMMAYSNKGDVEKIVSALNGEEDYTIENLRYEGLDFYSGDQYIFCVRGWGFLTGTGGMNFSYERAKKIQKSFVEYIFKTLKD